MLGATTPRQRQSQDQPDRKDKLARPEIQARPGTGGARGTLETRVNQARPEIQARLETGAVQDTPETWAKPARLETQGKREGVAIRVYKARPRHVRQESIATRTAILEERVVSGIKTGSSYFILINNFLQQSPCRGCVLKPSYASCPRLFGFVSFMVDF